MPASVALGPWEHLQTEERFQSHTANTADGTVALELALQIHTHIHLFYRESHHTAVKTNFERPAPEGSYSSSGTA